MSSFFNYYQSPMNLYKLSTSNTNFNALQKVVDDAIGKININLTEESFRIWLNYSKQIVSLVFKDNVNVYINYMNFCQNVELSSLKPHEKMSQVVKNILELMRFV